MLDWLRPPHGGAGLGHTMCGHPAPSVPHCPKLAAGREFRTISDNTITGRLSHRIVGVARTKSTA